MPHIVNERSHETFLRYLVGIGENILRVDLIKYLPLLFVIAMLGIVYYFYHYFWIGLFINISIKTFTNFESLISVLDVLLFFGYRNKAKFFLKTGSVTLIT